MNIKKIEAELHCINCDETTLHEVVYMGDDIEKITCLSCDNYLQVNEKLVISAYAYDIFKRVFSKPERMSNEIKNDLSRFVLSIPVRVVTKPYRMLKEYEEIKVLTDND